jgi:RES domain
MRSTSTSKASGDARLPDQPSAVDVPWAPSFRLVHSRFPPVGLFDACESEEEQAIVAEIQGLTKDRIQQELGRIHLVPEGDRLFGHGTTPVMAAFCYVSPVPTRFTDGSFGVYYAADSLDGAVAEVSHHLTRFMSATQEPRTLVTLRCYSAAIVQPLLDIRGLAWAHEPNAYGDTQALAARLRHEGAPGGCATRACVTPAANAWPSCARRRSKRRWCSTPMCTWCGTAHRWLRGTGWGRSSGWAERVSCQGEARRPQPFSRSAMASATVLIATLNRPSSAIARQKAWATGRAGLCTLKGCRSKGL